MKKKEIIDAVKWRCAIKDFDKTQKISDEDFDTLLEVVRYSPSSLGLEPWRLVVVQNELLRNTISPYATGAQRQLNSASHFVIFLVQSDLNSRSDHFKHICLDIKKMDEVSCEEFAAKFESFQKQKQDLTDSRKRTDWAGKQAYIALANMMMAAAFLGIDSCPIEGYISSKVEHILEKEGLIHGSFERVAVMAAFGYRNGNPNIEKTRRPMNEIVNFVL